MPPPDALRTGLTHVRTNVRTYFEAKYFRCAWHDCVFFLCGGLIGAMGDTTKVTIFYPSPPPPPCPPTNTHPPLSPTKYINCIRPCIPVSTNTSTMYFLFFRFPSSFRHFLLCFSLLVCDNGLGYKAVQRNSAVNQQRNWFVCWVELG